MRLRGITELVFKGTHNSYACLSAGIHDVPLMGHSPRQQIDDFGVWSVELDFAVKTVDGVPRAIVGHDDDDDPLCWGRFLRDYVQDIHTARSRPYRPVFFIFEVKGWGETSEQAALDIAMEDLRAVFGANNTVDLSDEARGASLSAVPELAGKAVFVHTRRFNRGYDDHCTDRAAVNQAIAVGTGLEGGCPAIPGFSAPGCRIIGIDQYQADWTFEYGVPANPLIVDGAAQPPWTVTDSVQGPLEDHWSCPNGDSWNGQVVHEQGTWRFPYRTVRATVTRAQGTTPNGVRDPLRAGWGWTVLIVPGRYRETVTVDIPLRLEKKPGEAGTVLIG
ncbi:MULTISPECIES: hypothetical protein [Streptomyces]|uniref:Phosphatidylinositol diacylglycerol-lyase n=1 Tax=Streptomyces luteosporeus TaxID=173856 RepID=A0ABN3TPW4_9ACTN